MTAFSDLSPYSYSEIETDGLTVLNIGWLGVGVPFSTGDCDPAVLARLSNMAESPVAMMWGEHRCELCVDRAVAKEGTGEVRVAAADGTVYAAPSLIVHYITEHHYLPPAEFRAAVLAGAAPS